MRVLSHKIKRGTQFLLHAAKRQAYSLFGSQPVYVCPRAHTCVYVRTHADFFNSAVNAPLHNILLALAFTYFGSIFIWGTAYYVLWR